MRQQLMTAAIMLAAATALGGEVAPPLSPDRPEDRAIMRYLETAEAGKASAADLTELGVLLASTGRLANAEEWLRKAVKADKHDFEARYRLGLVQQRLGRCNDAARSFARALDEKPKDPYARFMLALALERCGSAHDAIDEYARAYAALPDLANTEKNPLVLDSRVQTAAQLTYYRELVLAGTLPVSALDPAAVKAMMAARPPAPAAPRPTPAAEEMLPLPSPEPVAVPTPTPRPPG